MVFKPRFESKELKILRILNNRMALTEDEKKHYHNLKKGFEGEVQFDFLTEQLKSNCYILKDLLLKVNSNSFQNHTVIIYQDILNLFEVKKFENELIYKTDKLESLSGKEYQNPLYQLRKNTLYLRQLLQDLGFNLPIKGYVVFINPEFTLYQSPPNEPIIFPTQLKKFMKKLNSRPSKLTNKHKILAEKLVSLHNDVHHIWFCLSINLRICVKDQLVGLVTHSLFLYVIKNLFVMIVGPWSGSTLLFCEVC
ncbi:nuclease-related domain-containing protein [Neobacillus pocheonensis]|uniref:nuclease-related domain-containing protein n=1 Tax=Neobacillus pocheonensis TaxID=363869 RepID=UPI003D2D9138